MPVIQTRNSFLEFLESTRTPPEQFDEYFNRSCRSSRKIGIDPDPIKVVRRLLRNGMQCVVSGSHVASCWAGRMTGSHPIEIIAPTADAVLSCAMTFGTTSARYKDAHTGLFRYIVYRGQHDVIQIHPRKSPVMRRVWETRRLVESNPRIACTTPESSFVMRWISMTNPLTELYDQMYDSACIAGIVANCPNLLLDELRLLGDLLYRGGGKKILKVVADARAGKRIL